MHFTANTENDYLYSNLSLSYSYIHENDRIRWKEKLLLRRQPKKKKLDIYLVNW